MGIIGSGWKDEETPQEQYKEITGQEFLGTNEELVKELEKEINSLYTSRIERSKLMDLRETIENKNK